MALGGFPAASFDVVTSFRGIWATTPAAMLEARRVLRPGGRVALTFWGNVGRAPGGPLFLPFRLTSEAQLAHQADMNALGFPGVAARFLADAGLEPGETFAVPFFFEFADPEHYARALAATGPGYEAVQVAGEERFRETCLEVGESFARDGLPLRVGLPLLGIIGRAPGGD